MNGKEKILVLDNNKNWLTTIKNLLGDKYSLILTTSVSQAKRHVKDNSIALAILDQKLSNRQKGIRVLGNLRKDLSDLRAIILTDYPDDNDRRASSQVGALDYISKKEKHLRAKLIKSIERNKKTKAIHIFLAYQNDDEALVEDLYDHLTASGFIPWMAKKSALKGEWEPQTQKAIKESDYFVACFSSGSLRKKQSVFRNELKLARKIQKQLFRSEVFIIPVKLTDCEIPQELGHLQTIDLTEADGLDQLVKIFT